MCIGGFNLRNIMNWDLIVGDNEAGFLDNFLNKVIRESTRGGNILNLLLTSRDDLVREVDIGD